MQFHKFNLSAQGGIFMDLLPKNYNHEKDSSSCFHTLKGESLLRYSNGYLVLNNLTVSEGNLTQIFNQPIASITIDTTCLCKPKLLINFSGILTVTPLNNVAASRFTFTLFRICKDIKIPQVVSTFNFDYRNLTPSFPDSRTLDLKYSACDDYFRGCCTYIIELTSITNSFLTTSNLSINGTLSGLAIESYC